MLVGETLRIATTAIQQSMARSLKQSDVSTSIQTNICLAVPMGLDLKVLKRAKDNETDREKFSGLNVCCTLKIRLVSLHTCFWGC